MSKLALQGHRIPAPRRATEEFVRSKVDYLATAGVWPQRQKLDPYPWLKNFTLDEYPYAINLLNVFLYYSDALVDAMFRTAVHQLSIHHTKPATTMSDAQHRWSSYLDSVIVTYVEGEDPNPTDSGLLFARKARQVIGIRQRQILEPARALAKLNEERDRPILMVDDFVGSGNQTITTWRREYSKRRRNAIARHPSNRWNSFETASLHGADIVYVPIVATADGLNAVAAQCPKLRVYPVHVIDEQYSLASPTSVLWPDPLRAGAQDFLCTASKRAGIVDDYEHGWKGFGNLALPLAFSHTVPDATLPLYFWERAGWVPLLRRS